MTANLNGLPFYESSNGTLFVPLPREAWRSCGRCDCGECHGTEGFWDTLAIPSPAPSTADVGQYRFTTTYLVHYPRLQKGLIRDAANLTRGRVPLVQAA